MAPSNDLIWGGILLLIILAVPVVVIIGTFAAVNRRRQKRQPAVEMAAAKSAIIQGMYDQQLHREAMKEVLAEGSLDMADELRVQRIIQQIQQESRGGISA